MSVRVGGGHSLVVSLDGTACSDQHTKKATVDTEEPTGACTSYLTTPVLLTGRTRAPGIPSTDPASAGCRGHTSPSVPLPTSPADSFHSRSATPAASG